jgi:hypothetical protein
LRSGASIRRSRRVSLPRITVGNENLLNLQAPRFAELEKSSKSGRHLLSAAAILGPLIVFDPDLGLVARVPDALFPFLFFTDLAGNLVSGAPTPAEVAADGLNAPEPLLSSLNLLGFPPFAREEIDPGVFGPDNGTRLSVVSFQEDVLIRPEENAILYEHLTGQAPDRNFVVVTGPEAVHDLQLSGPEVLLGALAADVRF